MCVSEGVGLVCVAYGWSGQQGDAGESCGQQKELHGGKVGVLKSGS